MPKKIIALLLSVLVIVTAFALPTFAAEDETATVSEDTYQYVNNLIPFPYVDTRTEVNGVTFTVNADGSIRVKGTATATVLYRLCNGIPLETGQNYTLAANITKLRGTSDFVVVSRVVDLDGNDLVWLQSKTGSDTGTLYAGSNVSYFGIYITAGSVIDASVRPMLNVGNKTYPYSLYLPYILQQQYNNGLVAGEQNGYDKGYIDGEQAGYDAALGELDNMTLGVFESAVFKATLYGSYPSTGESYQKIFDFTPNFVYSGVYFSTLYDQINAFLISQGDSYWDYVDRVDVDMVWSGANSFDYQVLPLFISGDYDVNFGVLYTESGLSFPLDASDYTSSDKRKFVVDADTVDPLLVNRIVIRVGRPSDLLQSFTLYSATESYGQGYADGYASGYLEGENIGYINGGNDIYDEAFDQGFADGKKEGLSISETGDWRNLMLAVTEAPINTFQSLFNFEILGMDMRAAFGSVLALCVVLIILKKAVGM